MITEKTTRTPPKATASTVEPFISLADAKKVLGLPWGPMLALVRSGTLPAYNVSGRPVRREEVDDRTRGLRVLPSDLRSYMATLKLS